ncbi:hypothetical protein ABIB26_000727 [Arthrobacter sp. UYEF20]
MEQPRRNWNRDDSSELSTAQHRLDKCAADPAIAVGKRVDRFELSMGDRRLFGQGESSLHGSHVAHDQLRLLRGVLAELRQGDLSCPALVTFSISELAALSVRRRMDANGAAN